MTSTSTSSPDHIAITGRAGTGKTSRLQQILSEQPARSAIVLAEAVRTDPPDTVGFRVSSGDALARLVIPEMIRNANSAITRGDADPLPAMLAIDDLHALVQELPEPEQVNTLCGLEGLAKVGRFANVALAIATPKPLDLSTGLRRLINTHIHLDDQ